MELGERGLGLLRVYLSPAVGLGQSMSIDTIRRRLASYPTVDVLDLCAYLANRADASVNDRDLQLDLVREVFPAAQAARIAARMEAERKLVPFSSQVVLQLALHALVAPSTGAPTRRVNPQEFGVLLTAVAGSMPIAPGDENTILEMVRLGLWFQLAENAWWNELGYRMLFEVLPSMSAHRDWFDVHAMFAREADIPVDDLWALTAAHALSAGSGPPGEWRFPLNLENGRLGPAVVERWVAAMSRGIDDARERAAEDLDANTGWSFTAFYDRPLLQTGQRTILMRPQTLALKLSPLGVREFGERALSSAGQSIDGWSRLCGDAIELLARSLLTDHDLTIERLEDETEIRARWGQGKACDAVLLGDDWVAIDFVFRRVSKATATTGDFAALALDLERGVVDKLEQIDHTVSRGLATEVGSPPQRILPLVVVGAPWPVLGIHNHIDRELADRNPTTIGVDSRCQPPVVMDLAEFWQLLLAAERDKVTVAALLGDWLDATDGTVGFHEWLVVDGPGYPDEATHRYPEFVTSTLFHQPEGTS